MRPPRLLPVCLAIACLGGGAAVWLAAHPALGDSTPAPSASPSASVSPTPTATPRPVSRPTASPQLIHWSRHWARVARRDRIRVDRLRACLGRRPVRHLPAAPRVDSRASWAAYGDTCRYLAKRWVRESKRDWRRIVAPTPLVSAAQWRPALLYVGWPAAQLRNAVTCIRRESGGRPWATNGICDGLFQIHRCHHLAHPFDPLVNCRYALRLWRAQGWTPWTTM
jgi:hypothetical protein